jgi:acetyl-CoA carboxylase carboxyl transferase subunit beta
MAWWRRKKQPLAGPSDGKVSVPRGLWTKCDGCGEITFTAEFVQNLRVCPVCNHHHVLPTRERVAAMLDPGSWQAMDLELRSGDPLRFHDQAPYRDRISKAEHSAGPGDAFTSGLGRIDGVPASVGFFVFEFMGGSMGSVVGEKVTRVFERALEHRIPAVVFSASGGARMQEGILSLMQMAKTSAARGRLREAGIPYISVCLHPTTGGVAASFAMLGDLIVAEPLALVGFAGPRVVQQTIGQELPAGFQRAEFLLEHGMIDRIISRLEMREQLGLMLRLLGGSPSVSAQATKHPGARGPAEATPEATRTADPHAPAE